MFFRSKNVFHGDIKVSSFGFITSHVSHESGVILNLVTFKNVKTQFSNFVFILTKFFPLKSTHFGIEILRNLSLCYMSNFSSNYRILGMK